MEIVFEEELWSVEQAIVHICFGMFKTSGSDNLTPMQSEVLQWLSKPEVGIPSANKWQRKRAKIFWKRLGETNSYRTSDVKMHPVLWTWFAMSTLPTPISARFRAKFEIWTTKSLLACRMPVMQQRPKGGKFSSIKLDRPRLATETGVPVMALVYRPFTEVESPEDWRLQMHPLAGGEIGKSTKPAKTEGKSLAKVPAANRRTGLARSPACERALSDVVKKMCVPNASPISKVRNAADGSPRYSAMSMGQDQLLEVILGKSKLLTEKDYSWNTLKRSLSIVVATRRGRPPGTTNASKKKRDKARRGA